MSKSKDVTATKHVLDYLVNQNRPYSVVDVFNNLHKEYGKTVILKALEQLVSEGKIKEKTYGKQKIYFVDQSDLPDSKDVDLQKMDTEISNLNHTLNEMKQKIRNVESQYAALSKTYTTTDAEMQLQLLLKEIPKFEVKLESLRSNSVCIKPEEKDALYDAKSKYFKEWQKRKRMANDVINAIMESYPKDKNQLLEEIGIEGDEDFNLPKV